MRLNICAQAAPTFVLQYWIQGVTGYAFTTVSKASEMKAVPLNTGPPGQKSWSANWPSNAC